MVPGEPQNMGAWNTVRNYIDRTLEIVNFGDKSVVIIPNAAFIQIYLF